MDNLNMRETYVSSFEECIQDIEGMVRFAKPFSNRIVLQGHSLGCDRVLHYLISSNRPFDFVLLSPCDSYKVTSRIDTPRKSKIKYGVCVAVVLHIRSSIGSPCGNMV